MENLSNNQEHLELVIISFILMTIILDSGVMPLGEIRCLSLLGVKGLLIIAAYPQILFLHFVYHLQVII